MYCYYINILNKTFEDGYVADCGLVRLGDVNLCDYHLWANLENNV